MTTRAEAFRVPYNAVATRALWFTGRVYDGNIAIACTDGVRAVEAWTAGPWSARAVEAGVAYHAPEPFADAVRHPGCPHTPAGRRCYATSSLLAFHLSLAPLIELGDDHGLLSRLADLHHIHFPAAEESTDDSPAR